MYITYLGLRRGYMILTQPKNGTVPATTIRLPWQQTRVQIKVLTEDENNIFALYTLKHFKELWENWTTENDLTNKSLLDALDEIVEISSQIVSSDRDNTNSKLLFDKFNFPEIRRTHTYKHVKSYLNTNLYKRDLQNVENILKVILSRVEVHQHTNNLPDLKHETIASQEYIIRNRNPYYNESMGYFDINNENTGIADYAENIGFYYCSDDNANENTDKIACLLSMWLIFWPYGVNTETLYENSLLLNTVSHDRALFSESRVSSITEHIQFVMKAIEHLGHEVVYRK